MYFCLIRCKSPGFPKDFFNRNGTSPGPRSRCPGRPACHHRQIDTTMFALIYKIACPVFDPYPLFGPLTLRPWSFAGRAEPQFSLGKWWRGGWAVGLRRKVGPPLSYPAPCFFFSFCKPLPRIPTPIGFFWVGSRSGACGRGLIFFNFLFLVSHLLNHVGMWDLLLVPDWWKKIYIVIHPNPN